MKIVTIEPRTNDTAYGRQLCEELENGNILVLNNATFAPTDEESEFLRSQKQVAAKSHKNIAYKPNQDKTTGLDQTSSADAARFNDILSKYSKGALEFLGALLPQYSATWKVDYASFRPEEEEGRDLPTKQRNDLMHVDAFPTRPTYGGRILRMFTNLNPTRDRVWVTAESFEYLATSFAKDAGIDTVQATGSGGRRLLNAAAKAVGVAIAPERSAYDEFMLNFHHYLKANETFQENDGKFRFAFEPGITWLAFTDQVAHSVKSGQYAVEQTCIVDRDAMVLPEKSPLAVLERVSGRTLVAR